MKKNGYFTWRIMGTLHEEKRVLYMKNGYFAWRITGTLHEEERVLYMKMYVFWRIYLTEIFLEWEIFQTKFVE